jgi:outer membrane protein TolC
MPAAWRKSAPSADSLRPFYDSLRTSRDALLPPGADTARVAFAYDTTARGAAADSGATLRWSDLLQDSVLRRLVDTSLRENRDVRTALGVIDEFRAQQRAVVS